MLKFKILINFILISLNIYLFIRILYLMRYNVSKHGQDFLKLPQPNSLKLYYPPGNYMYAKDCGNNLYSTSVKGPKNDNNLTCVSLGAIIDREAQKFRDTELVGNDEKKYKFSLSDSVIYHDRGIGE